MKKMKKYIIVIAGMFLALSLWGQQPGNKPEREQWFMDMGFGMFIHWGVEVSVGAVISHSLAGASEDYINRYFNELPSFFNPTRFNPDEWAALAKQAGMKYVVFTTKHHSGFCMWNTQTTALNVMNTPFKRDVFKEIVAAFRKQGIAIGIYFSPDDFHYLHQQHIPIGRGEFPEQNPANNKGLLALNRAQIKELLTNYGPIDILFFDGASRGLKEYAWSLQPDIVVTRGQMKTPEQKLPDQPMPGPWEACFTMGTEWGYKPTNDPHKSGTDIINMLIEIRAKGGNFLLNVGPKPDGTIQIEQEERLREVALWNLVNRDAIHSVRPFSRIKEGNIWFTRSATDSTTVYAFIPAGDDWKFRDRKNIVFQSLKGNDSTKAAVLGFGEYLLEYRKGIDVKTYVQQTDHAGLLVSAVNGQRLYTNNKWPNPVVIKMEHVDFSGEPKEKVQVLTGTGMQ